MWVIDTASHFKNYMMAALEKSFGFDMSWRFSVANSPWSNGTCERMMREVLRTMNAMIQEERRNTQDWLELVTGVQRALNTAFCERYGAMPYHVMFGRSPRTALSSLACSTRQDWQVDVLDDEAFRKKV